MVSAVLSSLKEVSRDEEGRLKEERRREVGSLPGAAKAAAPGRHPARRPSLMQPSYISKVEQPLVPGRPYAEQRDTGR